MDQDDLLKNKTGLTKRKMADVFGWMCSANFESSKDF